MKKLLGMILTLALAAGLAWPVYAESSTVPPEVTAHAYLVMDAQTGQVLVQKGGAERNYPASITKIMTLALAMESKKAAGGFVLASATAMRLRL